MPSFVLLNQNTTPIHVNCHQITTNWWVIDHIFLLFTVKLIILIISNVITTYLCFQNMGRDRSKSWERGRDREGRHEHRKKSKSKSSKGEGGARSSSR